MPQRRRTFASLFIAPKPLALISLPFLFLIAISLVTVIAIHWKVIRALEEVELFGVENLPAMNALHQVQNSVTVIGAIGITVLAIASLVWWIILSHRIFGPIVPIRRHIQSLAAGNFNSRINMRAGDQLKEVVEDLNALAETLADKSSRK